jgi:hypothetical protein
MMTTHLPCPALAAPPPSQVPVLVGRGGTPRTTRGAGTAELVVLAGTTSCLDLVAVVAGLVASVATKYPGLVVAEAGSEVGAGLGVDLRLTRGVVPMAHRCRGQRTAWGRVADSKVKSGLIGGVVVADTTAVHVRQDLEVVRVARGGMAQADLVGAVDTE